MQQIVALVVSAINHTIYDCNVVQVLLLICSNLPETVYLHDFHSPANHQLAAGFSGVLCVAVLLTLPRSRFGSPRAPSSPLPVDSSAVRFHSRPAH